MIKISNSKNGVTTIDIEGMIGVPEEWQFDHPEGKVATYQNFERTLSAISQIRNAEIVVNIRSTGGDVGDAMLIHDALVGLRGGAMPHGQPTPSRGVSELAQTCPRREGGRRSQTSKNVDGQLSDPHSAGVKITTRCYGYVASAATIIAQAASPGMREMSKNALYLIHNSVGNCEGNAGDFRSGQELLAKTDARIANIYAGRSGRAADDFLALMSENNGSGRWLSPEEALANGLIDRVILDENAVLPKNSEGGLLERLRKTYRASKHTVGGGVRCEPHGQPLKIAEEICSDRHSAGGEDDFGRPTAGGGGVPDAKASNNGSLGPNKKTPHSGFVQNHKKSDAVPKASKQKNDPHCSPVRLAPEALKYQQDVELQRLRHRISTLESENAQLRAKPTQTKTKEDPSPAESRRSANENSYSRDVESFCK